MTRRPRELRNTPREEGAEPSDDHDHSRSDPDEDDDNQQRNGQKQADQHGPASLPLPCRQRYEEWQRITRQRRGGVSGRRLCRPPIRMQLGWVPPLIRRLPPIWPLRCHAHRLRAPPRLRKPFLRTVRSVVRNGKQRTPNTAPIRSTGYLHAPRTVSSSHRPGVAATPAVRPGRPRGDRVHLPPWSRLPRHRARSAPASSRPPLLGGTTARPPAHAPPSRAAAPR